MARARRSGRTRRCGRSISVPEPRPGARPVLEVDSVHTYYGESHVLHGISLRVGEGEVLTILGRNGAGKTTLIRSIIGFTPPREGRVRFRGEDITVALVSDGRRGNGSGSPGSARLPVPDRA